MSVHNHNISPRNATSVVHTCPRSQSSTLVHDFPHSSIIIHIHRDWHFSPHNKHSRRKTSWNDRNPPFDSLEKMNPSILRIVQLYSLAVCFKICMGFTILVQEMLAASCWGIPRRMILWHTRLKHFNEAIEIWFIKKWCREAFGTRFIHNTMSCWSKETIGPAFSHVSYINHECIFPHRYTVPMSLIKNLQTWVVIGRQQRQQPYNDNVVNSPACVLVNLLHTVICMGSSTKHTIFDIRFLRRVVQ